MIETVIGMAIFMVVAGALADTLTSAVDIHGLSRQRTLATQLADSRIDTIRAVPYDSIGLVGGNPGGVLPAAPEHVAVTGLDATLTTRISYVDDPVPNTYATGANYKSVVVTVTRSSDGLQLAQQQTYIAPPARAPYGGINNGRINVQVMDSVLATPIEGATVALANGPSPDRSDVTDANGKVSFPALTPNPTTGPQAYYDVTSSLANYQELKDDLPPASAAHVQLAPGQTLNTVLRLYQPATIYVNLIDALGQPYTSPASVWIRSSRAISSYAVSGGALTLTSFAGEPLVPDQFTVSASTATGLYAAAVTQTVPDDYPSVLTSTFTLKLLPATGANVNVHVREGGTPVSGATVEATGGPLPYYTNQTANAGGVADLKIPSSNPSGTPYTITAKAPNGDIGTTSGVLVSPPGTTVVNVDVAPTS